MSYVIYRVQIFYFVLVPPPLAVVKLYISSSQVLLFAFVCAASGRIFLLDDGGNVGLRVI